MRTLITFLVLTIGLTSGCQQQDLVSEEAGRDSAMEDGTAGEDASDQGSGAERGTLTAGAWDDNRNFDYFLDYTGGVEDSGLPGLPGFSQQEREAAWERSLDALEVRDLLDVALVIDTTGSMSDELGYLQVEFEALSQGISERYPNADQRWALVVYRDEGDSYLTRVTDFTRDLDHFQGELGAQSSGGGGDYPEAPEEGLGDALALDWRAGDNARLLFWVADAPHHDQDSARMEAVATQAIQQDVHIYPVAASGTDELTEYTMRSLSQLSLGRYLFLTDDSGVGGEHKEPSIPCYFVTRLDHAISRMVDIEMSGEYREPTSDELIRTGGDPQNGACELEDGETVTAF